MAQPLDPDTVTAVQADIRAGLARNEIARKHGISTGSVTNIAKRAGITTAFDRAGVARAHAARVADQRDLRSQRLAAAGALVDDMVARGTQNYAVIANGPDGPETVILPKPPLREAEAAVRAFKAWTDTQVMVERHESGTADTETAKSTLLGIIGLAREVTDASRPASSPPADGPDPLAVDR